MVIASVIILAGVMNSLFSVYGMEQKLVTIDSQTVCLCNIDNMSMLMQTYMMIWYLVEFILAMQRNLPKYVHVHVMVPDGDSYGEHRRLNDWSLPKVFYSISIN